MKDGRERISLKPRNLPRPAGPVIGPPRKHGTPEEKKRAEVVGLGRLKNGMPSLNAMHSLKKK